MADLLADSYLGNPSLGYAVDNSFKEQRVSHGREFSSDNTSILSLSNRKRSALVSCVWFKSGNQISRGSSSSLRAIGNAASFPCSGPATQLLWRA